MHTISNCQHFVCEKQFKSFTFSLTKTDEESVSIHKHFKKDITEKAKLPLIWKYWGTLFINVIYIRLQLPMEIWILRKKCNILSQNYEVGRFNFHLQNKKFNSILIIKHYSFEYLLVLCRTKKNNYEERTNFYNYKM